MDIILNSLIRHRSADRLCMGKEQEMTREEAISLIKSAQLMLINPTTNEPVSDLYEALEMAIQALSQEPCDDAIDREYLFKVLDDFCGHDRTATITLDTLADLVYDMPPVTQKSETETWNGMHGQITAPKGTFKKIFEDAESEE